MMKVQTGTVKSPVGGRLLLLAVMLATGGLSSCGNGSAASTAPLAAPGPFRVVPAGLARAFGHQHVVVTASTPRSRLPGDAPGPVRIIRYRTRGGTLADVAYFASSNRALRAAPGMGGLRRVVHLNLVVVLRHQGDDIARVLRAVRATGN